jgi:hypothetical protein
MGKEIGDDRARERRVRAAAIKPSISLDHSLQHCLSDEPD